VARRVIALLGGPPVTNEDCAAAEAITPGHLVTYDGSGDLIKHASSGGAAARNFALERDEMGKDIDTAYAVGDQVKVGAFHQGQRVYAFTPSGQNLAIGTFLESDGAGRLVTYSAGIRLARMVEAVNNSAGPGDARIRIEIV
jgi:hypothetical protein